MKPNPMSTKLDHDKKFIVVPPYKKHNMTKAISKTELPELRQASDMRNRVKNNHSINFSRVLGSYGNS